MKPAALSLLFLTCMACSQPAPPAKQYHLTGQVISVDAKEHTAKIDGAAIPNYMEAMKMDYPVPSDSELAKLKPGEKISATVNVSADGSYTLSNIQSAGK